MSTRCVISLSGATFVFLLCIVLIASAVPVGAQGSDGIPPGTTASGSNPGSPSSPPNTITIASEGCQVAEGASVTLRDDEGDTEATFTDDPNDDPEQIQITAPNGRVKIEGPEDGFIGDLATFPTDDDAFSTRGNYVVVSSTGITGCAQTTGTARDADDVAPTDDDGADGVARPADDGADDQQYGDRKEIVIVETVPDKPLPKTGGFPLLVGAGLMALAATVLGSRVIGRR